jgi:hypothetical protein
VCSLIVEIASPLRFLLICQVQDAHDALCSALGLSTLYLFSVQRTSMALEWTRSLDAQFAPGCAALASVLVLVVQIARARIRLHARRKEYRPVLMDEGNPCESEADLLKTRSHVEDHGGRVMFANEVLRAAATLGLLAVCAYTTFAGGEATAGTWVLNTSVVRAGHRGFSSRA